MNDQEKKAVEDIKRELSDEDRKEYMSSWFAKDLDIAVNLIEKLQKENEKYKRLSEMNLKNAEEFKNNMCEHRCLLKSENKELKEKIDSNNYIAKQKIRDILDVKIHNFNYLSQTDWNKTAKHIDKSVADILKQVLQELLEESEEK